MTCSECGKQFLNCGSGMRVTCGPLCARARKTTKQANRRYRAELERRLVERWHQGARESNVQRLEAARQCWRVTCDLDAQKWHAALKAKSLRTWEENALLEPGS